MTTTRFDMRLDEKVKAKVEKASTLLGLNSMTDYVIKVMDEHATKVIAKYENLIVNDDVFDRFMTACEKAKKPNKALKEALAFTKKQKIK